VKTSEALRRTRRGLAEEELARIIKEVGLERGAWLECEVTGDITPGLWKSISDALERNGHAPLPTCPSGTKESLSLLITPHLRPDEVIQDWIDPKSAREWPCGESDIIRIRNALAGAGRSFSDQFIRRALFSPSQLSPQEQSEYDKVEDLVEVMYAQQEAEERLAAPRWGHALSNPAFNSNMAKSRNRLESFVTLVEKRGTSVLKPGDTVAGVPARPWLNQLRDAKKRGRLHETTIKALEALPDWTWDAKEAHDLERASELEDLMGERDGCSEEPRLLLKLRAQAKKGKLHENAEERLSRYEWWPEPLPQPCYDIPSLVQDVAASVPLTALEVAIVEERLMRLGDVLQRRERVRLEDIGAQFGRSREAVRQSEAKIISRALHPTILSKRLTSIRGSGTVAWTNHRPDCQGPPADENSERENAFLDWINKNFDRRDSNY
jgi:hypothetical protein